jgi:hypothetical protein
MAAQATSRGKTETRPSSIYGLLTMKFQVARPAGE